MTRTRLQLEEAYEDQIAEVLGDFEGKLFDAQEEVLNQSWLLDIEDEEEVQILQDILLEETSSTKLNVSAMLDEIDRVISKPDDLYGTTERELVEGRAERERYLWMKDWLKLYFEDHNVPY